MDAEVVTFGAQTTRIGQAVEQVRDRARSVAHDARAARDDAVGVAVIEDVVDIIRDDGVVDLDVIPVQRQIQTIDPLRACLLYTSRCV